MAGGMERDRPQMPSSFGNSLEEHPFTPLEWAAVTAQLEASRNYWIGSVRPDGRPHVVPVWGVWAEDQFHFATDPKSVTARNLEQNPQASVNLESGDDCVILQGTFVLQYGTPGVAAAFSAKYDMPWGADEIPLFSLTLRKAFAWREEDFPSSATRWRFGE